MRLGHWTLTAVACCMLALGGCSKKDEGGNGKGKDKGSTGKTPVTIDQSSPKALMTAMHQAIESKNGEAMVACLPPEYQPAMRISTGVSDQRTARTDALKKLILNTPALGKEVAEKVFPELPAGAESPLSEAVENGKVNWDKIKFKEDGDKATVEVKGAPLEGVTLKKISGKWYCLFGNITPEQAKAEAEKESKHLATAMKGYDKFEKKIKSGTLTKENAQTEYFNAMREEEGPASTPD